MVTGGIRALLLRVVFLAGAVGLSAEYLLQRLKDASLCSADSCQAVAQLLRFQESSLVLAGAVFFWVLLILALAAEWRKSQAIWGLVLAVLLAGLAFEAALLGYQLRVLESICWLCLCVGAWLLLSGLALAWRRGSGLVLLLCLCVGLAGMLAPSLLRFQPQTISLSQTDFLERQPSQAGPSPELYLFFSLHCSHCSEVFANLALNQPWSASWHFVSIDEGDTDLARLAEAVQAAEDEEAEDEEANVFLELLRVKQEQDGLTDRSVPESLRQTVQKARAFFQSRSFSGIPLLIANEGPGRQVILTGTEAIAKYLWEKGLIRNWLSGRQIEQRLKQLQP